MTEEQRELAEALLGWSRSLDNQLLTFEDYQRSQERKAMFVVIENTPGYLPDDDDPPTFDDYAEAVEYLNERAREYEEDSDGNYSVEYGIASQDNLAAVVVHDHDKMHDLGRVIQIVREDEED